MALDACIAAPLALGFACNVASIRPFPGARTDERHFAATADVSRNPVVTAFESDFEARVESPCIRHCTLDDDDICLGCFRSIDEICAWGLADNAERLECLKNAALRRDSRDTHSD